MKSNRWVSHALAAMLALSVAVPAMAQSDKMAPIAIPAQPNAIALKTGPLPGAKVKESWHSQYNSVFARNVTEATLTGRPVTYDVADEDVQLHGTIVDFNPLTGRAEAVERWACS